MGQPIRRWLHGRQPTTVLITLMPMKKNPTMNTQISKRGRMINGPIGTARAPLTSETKALLKTRKWRTTSRSTPISWLRLLRHQSNAASASSSSSPTTGCISTSVPTALAESQQAHRVPMITTRSQPAPRTLGTLWSLRTGQPSKESTRPCLSPWRSQPRTARGTWSS